MSLVKNSILFSNLGDKEVTTVVNAMEEVNFTKGDHVITEGDKGDTLYLVAEGEFDCFKNIEG
jgi:CRP-like cAMP-binding protein